MSVLVIKQISSLIRRPKTQRVVIRSLGLGRIGAIRKVPDTRGMRMLLARYSHLVKVIEE